MLENFFEPVRDTLRERLASPLLASFTASWCLWNYKFIVILFSANSVERTFQLIDEVAFPDIPTILTKGVLYPTIAACIYIFLFPYPTRWVYGFTKRQQKKLNELKQSIEDETLLTNEESQKIRMKIREQDLKHKEEVANLSEEIEDLKVQLHATAKASVADQEPKIAQVEPAITSAQEHILVLLDESGGNMSTAALVRRNGNSNKTKTEFDLGELVRLGLLESNYDHSTSEYGLSFTHEGRGALIKMRQE